MDKGERPTLLFKMSPALVYEGSRSSEVAPLQLGKLFWLILNRPCKQAGFAHPARLVVVVVVKPGQGSSSSIMDQATGDNLDHEDSP